MDWDWSMLPGLWRTPAFMIAAVVGFVEAARKAYPRIDGPVAVPAFAVASGAVAGAAGQLFGLLTVSPFAGWTSPLGGLAYGAAAAVAGVLGVNLFEALGTHLTKSVVEEREREAAALLAVSPAAGVSPATVIDFALSVIRSRFGSLEGAPAFVWGLLETVVKEFAGQELSPRVQRAVQRRLLDLLAAAGAPGRDV